MEGAGGIHQTNAANRTINEKRQGSTVGVYDSGVEANYPLKLLTDFRSQKCQRRDHVKAAEEVLCS